MCSPGPFLEEDGKCTVPAQVAEEDATTKEVRNTGNDVSREDEAARESDGVCSLSPSPSIPLPPSPTPCSRTPASNVAANFSSSSTPCPFAPSHSLQMLLDAAASGDESEAGISVAGVSSELRGSGRACGLLLSPDEDAPKHRPKVRVPFIPAVTPTLARAPARLLESRRHAGSKSKMDDQLEMRAGKPLPPVTPTLARLQGLLSWEVFEPFSKTQRSIRDRSARMQSEDANGREKLPQSRKKNHRAQVRVGVATSVPKSKRGGTHESTTDHVEYPGFFQQVRELQARGLLGADESRAICSRAMAGDELAGDLICIYKQRKREHLRKGVHLHCTCSSSPPERRERAHRGTAGQVTPGTEISQAEMCQDWREFAKALKRLLNDCPAQIGQMAGRMAAR